jgi:D-sedoheptulose 7-phosphate isomerase
LRIVSTNGCFDLLHAGHVRFLAQARALGDLLVVGLNSDASITQLKGVGRPVVPQAQRVEVLAALESVDYVHVFDDLTPVRFLERLQPDVHCKAADYSEEDLPERDTVLEGGGEVRILPLTEGLSTSRLIERVVSSLAMEEAAGEAVGTEGGQAVLAQLLDGANVIHRAAYLFSETVEEVAQRVAAALPENKVLLCGNGGSAADAQHIAAELVGRLRSERTPLPALSLATDTSVLTAVANDFGYHQVFARQIVALGRAGDVLFALSTSGQSENVVRAVEAARRRGLFVVAFTGAQSSCLSEQADVCFQIPSQDSLLVQQAHMAILHVLCDRIEQFLADGGGNE